MDDLISRQMLLEYIHGEPVGRLLCDKYNLDGLIKQFPSAQPECDKKFMMLKVIDLNGRPYYSIIYLENGNEFEGYSSYDLKVISEYLKRYFGFAQPEDIQKIQNIEQAQFYKIHDLAYQEGKADAMRWISCSDRLPEYGEAVLTINEDEDYEVNRIIDEDNGEWFYEGAIAWMPLPPYKEVE